MELTATSNVLAAAAIGAGGAVLGTMVGGFITYMVERMREKEQRKRDKAAEDRVTQGIARVWSKKLGDFYHLVYDQSLGHEHSRPQSEQSWWKDEYDVNPEMDVEDMKRVAATAEPEQWKEIDYALTHVRFVHAAREYALRQQGIRHSRRISDDDIETLKSAMKQVKQAIEKLAELSDDPYPPDWLAERDLGAHS